MNLVAMLVIAGAVLGFGLVSARAEKSLLTPPMAFTALGLIAGAHGLGWVDFGLEHDIVHGLAEITLAVVLFADAARIDTACLRREHDLPQRMLLLGLPLAVVFGTAGALWLFPGLVIAEAALLAAVLAPTDAALGQAVVADQRVPVRIRQAINVESGLNDGLALPLVLILISFACATTEAGRGLGVGFWVLFTLGQVVIGPLVGLLFGAGAGRLFDRAAARGWSTSTFRSLSALGVAVCAFAAAELVHGNGFLAAFVAGLAFGHTARATERFEPFLEAEGGLMALLVFAVFGGTLLPEALGSLSWQAVLYAVLSLTLVRIAAIVVSLAGKRLKWPTLLFLGWFGPRGIASILFALVVIRRSQLGQHEAILPVVMITVVLSIVVHGMSAGPLARLYGAWAQRHGQMPEQLSVSEQPLRARRAP